MKARTVMRDGNFRVTFVMAAIIVSMMRTTAAPTSMRKNSVR